MGSRSCPRPPHRRIALVGALVSSLGLLAACTNPPPPTALPTPTPTRPAVATPSPTLSIAVTYVPTPTPYSPQLFATAITTAATFPSAIASAEAEGATFPRIGPPMRLPDVFSVAGGRAERRCVPVAGSGNKPVRSGDFVAGSFALFLDSWRQDGKGLVWWTPQHPLRNTPITVRAVRPGTPAETARQDIAGLTADHFRATVALPSGGTWLLIATGGPNWGCFILTLL